MQWWEDSTCSGDKGTLQRGNVSWRSEGKIKEGLKLRDMVTSESEAYGTPNHTNKVPFIFLKLHFTRATEEGSLEPRKSKPRNTLVSPVTAGQEHPTHGIINRNKCNSLNTESVNQTFSANENAF